MQATHIASDWDITAVRDARLRQIHAYWCRQRGARALPTRRDIDPVALRSVLPHVFLIDVLEGPRDYRFRLAGTYLRDLIGVEMTGRRIAEVFPPTFAEDLREHWGATLAQGAPKLCIGRFWVEARDYLPWEGIVLPLAAGERGGAMLLGGLVIGDAGAARLSA